MEGPPVISNLDVRVVSAGAVDFTFRVTNNEPRKVEVLFTSGQTHDIVVKDSIGRDVWRWSEGRMFTQATQNRFLESGESLVWTAAWRSTIPAGRYVAIATLLSENKPVERRVDFEVP